MKKAAVIIILLVTLVPSVFAQGQLDSLEYIQSAVPLNILSSTFSKQLNTFNLNSILEYYYRTGGLNLSLNENFNTTYIRSIDPSSRDQHSLTAGSSYSVNPYFGFGLHLNNDIYSDSRQIDINQASMSALSAYAQINPFDKVAVSPFFGYENNRQVGESDNGLMYGAEGSLDNYSASNFILLSQLKFENEDISPRKNTLRYFNFAASNSLEGNFLNTVNYQYLQNRKDFYFIADSVTASQFGIKNNIQSRTETNNILRDNLQLENFLSLFTQNLSGMVSWRTIDRNTKYKSLKLMSPSIFDDEINELKIQIESVTNFRSDIFDGSLRFNYSERDERHQAVDFPGSNPIFLQERQDQENMKNNISKQMTLSFNGSISISPSDKLNFSLFQNKLRYDTPSQLNYDDRDELLSIARLNYVKTLNPFFDIFMNLEGTYNQIVYIYSEESSNNNINRILNLTTGGTYRGKNVTSTNSFEVSANYTVYNFEDITTNYRSYSFRQFSAVDSSEIKLNGNISLTHFGYVKLSEQGDLTWATFSTHPTRYLKEIYSEPKFVFKNQFGSVALGLRFYSLSTFNYKGLVKTLDTKYESTAPLTEISISMNNALTVNLLGWYEFIVINKTSHCQQANLTLSMNWNF